MYVDVCGADAHTRLGEFLDVMTRLQSSMPVGLEPRHRIAITNAAQNMTFVLPHANCLLLQLTPTDCDSPRRSLLGSPRLGGVEPSPTQ